MARGPGSTLDSEYKVDPESKVDSDPLDMVYIIPASVDLYFDDVIRPYHIFFPKNLRFFGRRSGERLYPGTRFAFETSIDSAIDPSFKSVYRPP